MKKFLSEEQAREYHNSTEQLILLSTIGKIDIQTSVVFLTTKGRKYNEDEWGKLKRLLNYLKGMKLIKSTLSVQISSVIQWWVDASYINQRYCKRHTGAML